MLWLCLHLPHLPAEARGLRDPIDAVVDSRGAQRWLITAPPGLAPGMPLADALARNPALRAHARKPAAERAALKTLAHWIYRYGSPVTAEIQDLREPGRVPRALLWVEIGASRRLFGGLDALHEQLCADLVELQQSAQLAVAPTRAAAALLACAGHGDPVPEPAQLERVLARLPVELLPWPQAVLDALHGIGLRRLGELFRLPRAGFARRFGAERLLALDRMRGRVPEPLRAITPPPVFRRRFELPGEVETLESLLFPLRRMSVELQHWLRARDIGLRSLRLRCEHAGRQHTTFGLRFLSAHRDAARIFDTLRERLNRAPLDAPVRALHLSVDDLGAVAGAQMDLFGSESHAQLRWNETVERLLARLGEQALWTPAVVGDHRPERAGVRLPPSPSGSGDGGEGARLDQGAHFQAPLTPDRGGGGEKRPLWLLPTPVPLPAAPTITGEPERVESGWWDGADARRDYHTIDWQQARAWVFREHASGRWFLHGWWG
ncbi:MAG: Y-family DNA polymerase [Gammaproteobacteria bacterium]